MMSRGSRNAGMPYWSTPPTTCSASNTVTSQPYRTRSAATASPAGPEPTMATLPSCGFERGGAAFAGRAWSPTNRSSRPIATDSSFLLTHALALALRLLRADAAADRGKHIGFVDHRQCAVDVANEQLADEARNVDPTGQPEMHAGLAHWMQRSASAKASAVASSRD